MEFWIGLAIAVAAWTAIQVWVLPRLGVAT